MLSTKSSSAIRLRVAGTAALAVTMGISGCAAEGGASGGVTTVTVMYQANEFTPEHIEAFEAENPDIKIEFIEFDQTRLNAMLTAGDPPDFVRGSPSANLFARGLATPLDDYLATSEVISEDDLVSANDVWRWDGERRGSGQLYGILKDWSPDLSIWQNEAILEAAGVEPLSITERADWDTVLEKAKQLKAAGVEFPFGIEWQWGVAGLYQAMIAQQGGSFFSNEDLSEVDLQTPEALRAFQWLADFATSDVGPHALTPLADGWNLPVFSTGRMAMALDGFWFGGGLQGQDAEAVQETISMTPAPTFGEPFSPIMGGVGAWIPEGSDAKDEAWRVLEFFMAGPPAEERAASGWGLPALESLWDRLPTALQYQKDAIETARAEVEYTGAIIDSPYLDGGAWTTAMDLALQSVILGEKTVEEASAQLEDEVNALLAQGKDQLG